MRLYAKLKTPAVDGDWTESLRAAALELQVLNTYSGANSALDRDGLPKFPRPIACNPDSASITGFLGDMNGKPDADGYVEIVVDNYEYIDLDFLPAQPQTFSLVLGYHPRAGKII